MDKNLEQRIQALEKWQKERQTQQIVYPLDAPSVTILNKYFMSIVGTIVYTNAGGLPFTNWLIRQGGTGGTIQIGFPLFRFTASAATNILTIGLDVINNSQGSFQDNDQVFVTSTDTLPSPLITAYPYYVVSSTGTTIKLSDTLGGAEIDLTTAGVGEQFIQYFN